MRLPARRNGGIVYAVLYCRFCIVSADGVTVSAQIGELSVLNYAMSSHFPSSARSRAAYSCASFARPASVE